MVVGGGITFLLTLDPYSDAGTRSLCALGRVNKDGDLVYPGQVYEHGQLFF